MSRLLYVGIPAHGHVNPSLALVKHLVEAGEEVFYISSKRFDPLIREVGAFNLCYETWHEFDSSRMSSNFLALESYLLEFTMRLLETDFLDHIAKLRPAYIIHDQLSVWGRCMAKILGLPAINVITTFVLTRRLGMKCLLYSRETAIVKGIGLRPLIDLHKLQFNLYRRFRIGLEPPFAFLVNPEDLNIVFTSRYFQPMGEKFGNRFVFVGPCIEERLERQGVSLEIGEEDTPVVYISLGTIFSNNPDFYRLCFSAFSGMPFRFVLSTGDSIPDNVVGETPDNFVVRKFVHQMGILRRASVFVTHGGMNSIQEAIFFRVPMVVIPQGADQPLVASRVSELGAGLALKPSKVNPGTLREAVERVYLDSRYKKGCEIIAMSFSASGGMRRAMGAISRFRERAVMEV